MGHCISILCIQEHIPLILFMTGKYIYMQHVLSQLVGGGAGGGLKVLFNCCLNIKSMQFKTLFKSNQCAVAGEVCTKGWDTCGEDDSGLML